MRGTVVRPPQLIGTWVLRRDLEDLSAGATGTMDGTLSLQADEDQIVWAERGTLRWGDLETPVERTYLLRDGGEGWWVHFDDGRPFHPWRPGEWVEHLCSEDLYRGLVVIEDTACWHVTWRVRGPRKDQRLQTLLVAEEP